MAIERANSTADHSAEQFTALQSEMKEEQVRGDPKTKKTEDEYPCGGAL